MSRIGKEPVAIAAGVTVAVEGNVVTAKGKQGELAYALPNGISAEVKDGHVNVLCSNPADHAIHSCHGLARTLIANMVKGVADGYAKGLEIEGVGFKAAVQGDKLSLSLGFANAKIYAIPAGVKVTADNTGTKLTVAGPSKELVGRVAADIRSYFPAEPYKGKGVKYAGEKIRRKEGKTVA
ncbi:MAG: 50S ribosomal protein L6 [Kiritimatiellaeota bacterium]|nr:50S ribosomal protein L6 [Kiritimatiellota bacterium]